jgi:hypothetical protein|tara:strand:+ start:3470 stop:3664 length:195 start_codon:yes stop_codon:yes gene_type:complete
VRQRPQEINKMNEINKVSNNPVVESSMFKSMDGKWFIHKTTITTIKSINYLNKVLEDPQEVVAE